MASPVSAITHSILTGTTASIKRIAWAFGCAKKNSDDEIALYRLLLEKVAEIERGRVECVETCPDCQAERAGV